MGKEGKDLAKVVHQLRLLLVEREEEIEKLKAGMKGKTTPAHAGTAEGDSGELSSELTEQKETIASLEKSLEELRSESEERLRELKEELEEREKTIASLRDSLGEDASSPEDDERLETTRAEIEMLKDELARVREEREDSGDDGGEIEALRNELARVREESGGKIEGLEKELEEAKRSRGRLSSLRDELEASERSLRAAREECRRLSVRSVWLMAACAVLGVLLCISFIAGIRGGGPPPEGAMDFITASEEELLDEGDRISPPAPHSDLGPAPVVEAGAGRIEYVVRPGDSLWKICKRELGDPSLADRVARENNLKNARALKVGQILLLPASGPETP